MRRSKKELLRLMTYPLTLACGVLPIPMIAFTYLQSQLQHLAWLFPVCYFLLATICLFLPGKVRLPFALLAGVIALLPWGFYYSGEAMLLGLTMTLLFVLLLLWSLRIARWGHEDDLSAGWIGLCFGLQIIGQAVLLLDRVTISRPLQPMSVWFYVSFFVVVILCLFTMNRRGMQSVTTERTSAIKAMRHKNLMLLIFLVVLTTLFGLLPSLFGALKPVFKWISQFLKLFQREITVEPETPSTFIPAESGEGPAMPIVPNVGVHTVILNNLFQIFCIILASVLIPLLVYFGGKRLIRGFKNLWRSLREYVSENSGDYVDEITDIHDTVIAEESEVVNIKRKRIFSDRGLSDKEKIRHRYRQLQKKNPHWGIASTARENLPQTTAQIYEKARYSPHPVTSEDADQFKTETKRM